MLSESSHIRLEAEGSLATLWLDFPGQPVNALTPHRLLQIEKALVVAESNPHLELLVIRSGRPAGFCGGHEPLALASLKSDADRAAFARTGQQVLHRLAASPLVSVALLTGPCRGPGLELALACDYRLAVGGPDSWLGFADVPPSWGGSARIRRLVGRRAQAVLGGNDPITAREAHRLGLVDDAFSDRRAKVELQLFLDRRRSCPRKRWRDPNPPGLDAELARERAVFRRAGPWPLFPIRLSNARLPNRVAITGSVPGLARMAVELSLRGVELEVERSPLIEDNLAGAVARGRVTPLEAEQARNRLKPLFGFELTDLVVYGDPESVPSPLDAGLSPRTIVAVPVDCWHHDSLHPQRIVEFVLAGDGTITISPGPDTSTENIVTLQNWLNRLGLLSQVANRSTRSQLISAA